jgi:Anti-sigma factor NepR
MPLKTDPISPPSHNQFGASIDTLINKAAQQHVEQLRSFYGPVDEQPLPDTLRDLLNRLEEALHRLRRQNSSK